jgi:hypothetical protein
MKILILGNEAMYGLKVVTKADAKLDSNGISLGISSGIGYPNFLRIGPCRKPISQIAPGMDDGAKNQSVGVQYSFEEGSIHAEVVFIAENAIEEAALSDAIWHERRDDHLVTLLGVKPDLPEKVIQIGAAIA